MIQKFSNDFAINGIDTHFRCFPTKECALKAFELVYLQPFIKKYSNGSIEIFKNKIKELEKNNSYSDLNAWNFIFDDFSKNNNFPKFINILNYTNIKYSIYPYLINDYYYPYSNIPFKELDLLSNACPEQLFRYLIVYWDFDFITNKFYPSSDYFNLDIFSEYKIKKSILNHTYFGKTYLNINKETINSNNSLDYIKYLEFKYKNYIRSRKNKNS